MTSPDQIGSHGQTHNGPEFALPQPYFVSPEWFQRDLDRVFMRRWLFVDHATRIAKAGDFLNYELGKQSVLVTRGTDGKIHAFHNSCRHRGARICSAASGNTKSFMCPYHTWTYGLDGRLKSAARMPDLDKSQYSAVPVWVEEWNGLIFINMGEEQPRCVADHLQGADVSRYALHRTKAIFERTYVVGANWKVCAETYNECYHCAIAHPQFCKLVNPFKHLDAYSNTSDAQPGNEHDYVIYTPDMRGTLVIPGARTYSANGQIACKKPLGDSGEWHPELAALSWYPQFGLFAFPDYAYATSWKPVSENKTLFRTVWMVHEDAVEGQDYDPANVAAFTDLVNEEDTGICENAQRGIESAGYRPGPYHPDFEGPLRAFKKVYLGDVGTDLSAAGAG